MFGKRKQPKQDTNQDGNQSGPASPGRTPGPQAGGAAGSQATAQGRPVVARSHAAAEPQGATSRPASQSPVGQPPASPAAPGSRAATSYAPVTQAASAGVQPPRAAAEASETAAADQSEKRLIVGRSISLTGEIRRCDCLVVEGEVEADLNDSRALEISESGVFKGSATISEAEIAGYFDGDLTVKGRLFIRSTGRVSGQIHYGRLEIENGGRIGGTLVEISGENPSPGRSSG